MRRAASLPLLRHIQETDEDGDDEDEEVVRLEHKEPRYVGSIAKQVSCMTLRKQQPKKLCDQESPSCEKYGSWRQELRTRAASLKKQLKARWTIKKLIDEQMTLFEAHYNRATAPTKMTDLAQLLMPKWIPAHEQAAVFWLGDWRPSTILEVLRSLTHSLWEPGGVERALAQLINDVRIEEAVIDEEMTEIQANCVLNLPFSPVRNEEYGLGLAQVRSEFKKIHRVIIKAQNLRMKALELAMKVLSQIDGAEFLVAFVGIQDAIHEFSVKYKSRKGTVCVKDLAVSFSKLSLISG